MNIAQYLTIKQGDIKNNYLLDQSPVVLKKQMVALINALGQYLVSECVLQSAKPIKHAQQILLDTNANTKKFVHGILYGVVYNYLNLILPVDGTYVYDAGICKGACGYGKNRVVALLGNCLIDTNIHIEDIRNYPDQMLIEFWTSFKSLTLAQMQGTGINYNFRPQTCVIQPKQVEVISEGYQAPTVGVAYQSENMYATDIKL